jgi:hypothetical protein
MIYVKGAQNFRNCVEEPAGGVGGRTVLQDHAFGHGVATGPAGAEGYVNTPVAGVMAPSSSLGRIASGGLVGQHTVNVVNQSFDYCWA